MSQFPDHILESILCRLTVKCLQRLRCVSKSWLALISDPCFVKLHLNRSAQTKINSSLFLMSYRLYQVDFDSLDDELVNQPAVADNHPLNFEKVDMIWDSFNGLICISYFNDSVFLWNPSTRKSLELPHEPVELPDMSNAKSISRYAIGYTCNDYKVVRSVDVFDPSGNIFDCVILIYSLNSNSWHRSKKFPYFLSLNERSGNIVVGGALHWIFALEAELQEKSRIFAFDLGTEEYRFIPEPDYRGPHVRTYLLKFEGCLGLYCQYYDPMTADIWLLKEYGGKNESWMRLITFLPMIQKYIYLKPIAYSKSGKKILVEMDWRKHFWYNLEQKSLEDIRIHFTEEEDDRVCIGITCLESLVSVDVTTLANAKNPQEDDTTRVKQLGVYEFESGN